MVDAEKTATELNLTPAEIERINTFGKNMDVAAELIARARRRCIRVVADVPRLEVTSPRPR